MSQDTSYKLYPLGDDAILVRLGVGINEETAAKLQRLNQYIDDHPFEGFVEQLTSYQSLAIYYDPLVVRETTRKTSAYQAVADYINVAIKEFSNLPLPVARKVTIPVCYDDEFGLDIQYVADYNNLSVKEVIDIHTSGDYLVYMMGFSPGFPYMGGMDPRIATPRLNTPRLKIPARSIGIAGSQTGGYSFATPGGWQLIGRTPISLFNPNREEPSLLRAGDRVTFTSITKAEYETLLEEVDE
jgi:inhibitor of KinA